VSSLNGEFLHSLSVYHIHGVGLWVTVGNDVPELFGPGILVKQ